MADQIHPPPSSWSSFPQGLRPLFLLSSGLEIPETHVPLFSHSSSWSLQELEIPETVMGQAIGGINSPYSIFGLVGRLAVAGLVLQVVDLDENDTDGCRARVRVESGWAVGNCVVANCVAARQMPNALVCSRS